jgi:hypothetical protein
MRTLLKKLFNCDLYVMRFHRYKPLFEYNRILVYSFDVNYVVNVRLLCYVLVFVEYLKIRKL